MGKKQDGKKMNIKRAALLYLLGRRIGRKEKQRADRPGGQGKTVRAAGLSPDRILYRALGGGGIPPVSVRNASVGGAAGRKGKDGRRKKALSRAIAAAAFKKLNEPVGGRNKKKSIFRRLLF